MTIPPTDNPGGNAPMHAADERGDARPDIRLGQTIDGRYQITRLIGRGGMGSVYEARHITLDRRFAIKFLLPEFAKNADMLRRFENEAKAAGRLEHMNIAAATDFGRCPDGAPFLVMEYLLGEDCSKMLVRTRELSVARATNIAYQACLGLSVAHLAGIVHRDVKPENLFIQHSADGEDWVKVLDFGIAKLRNPDASVMTATGATMGTIFYMSPEQIRDSAKVDERTDIWAMGIVLYELLTHQRPFAGSNVTEAVYQIVHVEPQRVDKVRSELPRALAEIIHRAIDKDPERRFASAEALAEAIRPFTNRPSIPVPRPYVGSDETIASPPDVVRREANTSQLGATALPPSKRSSWQWRWPILGAVGIAAALWLYGHWVTSRGVVTSAARSLPIESATSTVASLTASGDTAAAGAAALEHADSDVRRSNPMVPPLPTLSSVQTSSGQHLEGRNRSGSLVSAPSKPKESDPPVAFTSPPARDSASASPLPASPASPPKANTASGVPITIDPHNPF